ncbi:MAG TPA: outer-membrane lipoprotein carrier protein LolA [Gemmatimonadales bacterium]|jgi:outer membrane lipoprotein carrier protein|nr:outer-membrane lipoprotein carrier protein LolA [Gemmatimonadales bacterium]
MRRPVLALAACAVLASTAGAQTTSSDPGVAIIRNASRIYQALTGFQANFHLHTTDTRAGDSDGKGVLSQMGKSLFAMHFTDPPHDEIIMDGTRLWVYVPSSNPGQVLRFPIPAGPTYETNVLGWFLDNPIERYRITFQRTETLDRWVTDVVLLEPLSRDMQFRRAWLWIDRDDGYPRRIDTEDATGVKHSLQLSDVRANPAISPSVFVFTRPSGVKIIDQ